MAFGDTQASQGGDGLGQVDAESLIGTTLDGRYEIVAPLGEGGMGTVFHGRQQPIGRDVAIKVVHVGIATDNAAQRFLREAKLSSRLNAPNIVQIYDSGRTADGTLYIVMELLRGATLSAVLSQCGSLPPSRAVGLTVQLCDALEAAHQLGIVHRDLKPTNIMLIEGVVGDLVKVLDFGLAKSIVEESGSGGGITTTHSLLGTPLYMAPEQIESSSVDARADLYALGCLLYEMLAGTPPFVDDTMTALFAKHLTEAPPPLPPSVPVSLAAVVERLLAKAPNDRFASATALRDELYAIAPMVGTPVEGVPIIRAQTPPHGIPIPHHIPTPPGIPLPPGMLTPHRGTSIAPQRAPTAPPPPERRIGVIVGVAVVLSVIGIVVAMLAMR